MKLIEVKTGEKAYLVESINELFPFLASNVETIGYDVETYLTKVKLGKNGKPLAKQPGHNPWNARTRLHQFYSPLVCQGIPLVVDIKTIDFEVFKQFLHELFYVRDNVRIYAHYAIFDGSFLYKEFGVFPKNLCCTQIQAQIYFAGLTQGLRQSENQSKIFTLAAVYRRLFGGEPIDKTLQSSDWSNELSNEQVIYAAKDVLYCHDVGVKLQILINKVGLNLVEEDEQYGLKAFIFARIKGQSIDIVELKKLEQEYAKVAEQLRLKTKDCFNVSVPVEILQESESTFKTCMNAYIKVIKQAISILQDNDATNPNQKKITTNVGLIAPIVKTAFNAESYEITRVKSLEELNVLYEELKRYTDLLFNSKHLKNEKDLKSEAKKQLGLAGDLLKLVFGFVDLNPNSSQQMKLAFKRIGINLESTGSKVLSAFLDALESDELYEITDQEGEKVDYDQFNQDQKTALESLMLYRSVATGLRYIQQFIEAYNPTTKAIHGEFRPMATQGTGRSACGKPSIQIVPRLTTSWKNLGLRGIREAFKHPDPDYKLISLDSAGCHVQIARTYSNCPVLIDIHNNAKDPYVTLGVEILKLQGIEMDHDSLKKITKDKTHPDNYRYSEARQLWKKVFLSCLNGAGAKKIFIEVKDADPPIKGVTLEDCETAVKVFHTTFHGLSACQKELVSIANSYDITSPFGCYQTYKITAQDEEITLTTNRYGVAKSIDGGRYFLPMMYKSYDLNRDDFDPNNFVPSVKNTEVLAFSWQRVEGSCVKRAAYMTVIWLIENRLDNQAWLCNLNHDEKVIMSYGAIAEKVAIQANTHLQQSFRRYVPDYLDRADISEKILTNWSEKN